VADPTEEVRVRWYCSYYVGPPVWHGTEYCEPRECGTEFETGEDPEEFHEGGLTRTCPKCSAELSQRDDCPELVK